MCELSEASYRDFAGAIDDQQKKLKLADYEKKSAEEVLQKTRAELVDEHDRVDRRNGERQEYMDLNQRLTEEVDLLKSGWAAAKEHSFFRVCMCR